VRAAADDLITPEAADTAVLLTSELVTNAVTHGSGPVTLAIEVSAGSVAVSVGDGDPAAPEVQPERLLSLGGRGLRMVQLLASEWGVDARTNLPGKVVWFKV
jgi:anti-sigma regulatory factor (Ser/Thr protein kinase)